MESPFSAEVAQRLYYDSAEWIFRARVADIQLVAREPEREAGQEQLWRVALHRTAFYPESGGQPWDTGVLVATARSGAVLEVPVERVEEDEAGEVWHFVRKPLVEGTEVEGRVDADRRRDHTQQHSGQHLLSAVFLEQTGARTVSFHLGAEVSTIDLQLPGGETTLTREALLRVETAVNALVFEDRPVISHWKTREEAEAMLARGELRKLPERAGPMRLVEIAGVEWNACGGTHVRSLGAIAGLHLRRTEKVRQGLRVEFVCGLRAVRAARGDFELLGGLAAAFSTGAQEIPARVSALQAEIRTAARAQRDVLEELALARAAELGRTTEGQPVAYAVFRDKPLEFAKRVALTMSQQRRAAVVGCSAEGKGAVVLALATGEPGYAGEILRAAGAPLGVRGGGSASLAQGVCEDAHVEAAVLGLAAYLKRVIPDSA